MLVRRADRTEKLTLALAASSQKPAIAATTTVRQTHGDKENANDRFWKLFGAKLTALGDQEKSAVGPRYRGGMRVAQVRANSPAAQHGIQQGDILVGLHIWETVNFDNISYVVDHPQLRTFAPLKFYVLRGEETLAGQMPLSTTR